MKRIAIFGSCISRDSFNSSFNPNYKDFFEVSVFQNQVTFLSIMSHRAQAMSVSDSTLKSNYDKQTLKAEMNNDFFDKLSIEKPDFLIIDLFADVYFGAVDLGENNYFTDNVKYFHIPELKSYRKIKPYDEFSTYFSIWKEKAALFFEKLSLLAPNTKIFIVKTLFMDTFEDGTSLNEVRREKNIMAFDITILNMIYSSMLNHVTQNFKVDVLDMTTAIYRLDKQHPWGQLYVHYESKYYHDFFNKLQKIMLNDLFSELATEKKQALQLQNEMATLKEIDRAQVSLNKTLSQTNTTLNKRVKHLENESLFESFKRKWSNL